MPEDSFWSKVAEITAVMGTWVDGMSDPAYVPNPENDLAGIGLTNGSWKRVIKRQKRSMHSYIEKNPAKIQRARYKQLRVAEKLEENMPVEILSAVAVEALTASSTFDVDSLHGNAVNTMCASISVENSLCPSHFIKLVARFVENKRIEMMEMEEVFSIVTAINSSIRCEVEKLKEDIEKARESGTNSTFVPDYDGARAQAGVTSHQWKLLIARLR